MQWIFVLVGGLMAIVAAMLSGHTITKKEKQGIVVEEEIEDINKKIITGRDHQTLAAQKFNSADLFLVIMQSASQQKSGIWIHMSNVVKNIIDGLCDRYMAVYHKVPNETDIKHWNTLANSILSDRTALEQIHKIEHEFLEACVEKEKGLFEHRKILVRQKSALDAKIEKTRYTSITFQILGLIVVLIKDLFSQ